MAYPTAGTETPRPEIAEAFMQMDLEAVRMGFVGLNVFPLREVAFAHGTYPEITAKELMRLPNTGTQITAGHAGQREPRSAYVRDDFKFQEASYATKEHGFEGVVDENEAAHYRSYMDHVTETAAWVRHRLLTQLEIRIANTVFDSTAFSGQTAAISTKWDVWASADPISDVFTARHAVYDTYGVWPDAMVMNQKVFENLKECAAVRDRIHSQGAGDRDRTKLINTEMLAQIFNVDDIHVASGTYDAAAPNSSTFTPTHIWGNDIMVYKQIRGGSIREVGLGHTLHWAADRSMPQGYVESYREPQTRAEVIRVRHQTQELLKYKVGYLLTAALT